MPAVDYITLEELRNQTNQKTDVTDARLAEVITAVSRWVDDWCERHFWQDGTVEEPVTRVFDACGPVLDLGVFNDLVELVEIDGEAPSGVTLRPRNRSVPEPRPATKIDGGFRAGQVVEVTGVWGWPQIPAPVPEATLIQAARVAKRKDSTEGVVGMDQYGMIRVGVRPDPDVVQILERFVHPAAVKMA